MYIMTAEGWKPLGSNIFRKAKEPEVREYHSGMFKQNGGTAERILTGRLKGAIYTRAEAIAEARSLNALHDFHDTYGS